MKTALILGAAMSALFIGAVTAQAQTGIGVSAETEATVYSQATYRTTGNSTSSSAQVQSQGEEKKGNVEVNWKVEEGESAEGDNGSGEQEGRVNKIDAITIKQKAIEIEADDVRGWDPEKKQEFMATVKAHAQVKSGQDLENFAKGILLSDENVEKVSADEDSVEVRYRVPAKFLGIFETTLPVDVVAEKAQGELGAGVKVKFPWYRVLFGIDEEVSETSIENDVSAAVIADLDRDGALDVAVAARLYVAISNVLKTKHDTAKNSIGNIR